MTHTDAIRSQIHELEEEVRKDPRVAAIQHLKAALAALEATCPVVVVPEIKETPQPPAPMQTRKPATGTIRKESKIARIGQIVDRYLAEHGPTHRSVLVGVLTEAGLNEGVKNPLTAFATSMHTLKEFFVSDGQGTFRRRESTEDALDHFTESPQGDAGGVPPPAASVAEPHDRKHAAENGTEAGGT